MPIEIRKKAKIAILVTIFGIMAFYRISNLMIIVVSIIVLTVLLNKINNKTKTMEELIEAFIVTAMIAAIALVVLR